MNAARPSPARAEALAARGRAAEDAGDFGEAVSALLDAAEAFAEAGDDDASRECAKRVLALWPQFEESKSLVMRPAKQRGAPGPAVKRLRRLPKAGEPGKPEASQAAAPAADLTTLPSMFIEMHAQALRMAGRDREARKRFDEALTAVEAEVARRRLEQAWSGAFSAGQSLLRLARRAGGEGRLNDARREFVAVAREAAREALTAEYLARGNDALPVEAVEAALAEARALQDEALIREVGRDAQFVLGRTAELLEALSEERTAAEAILSWEDSWTFIDSRPGVKRALLEHPELASSLGGPLAGVSGLGEKHPARVELAEFARRLEAVVAHARATAPSVRARLAKASPR